MNKKMIILMLCGLFLISCQSHEEPETFFGTYVVSSIESSRAIDISGKGEVSANILSQLRAMGKNTQAYFLNIYSPEYFNSGFLQVTFQLPQHLPEQAKIQIENMFAGRRLQILENGSVNLQWQTNEMSRNPNELSETFIVNSMEFTSNRSQELLLEVTQKWFDHSVQDWTVSNVTYIFSKN